MSDSYNFDPSKAMRAMQDTDRPAMAMARAGLTFAIQTELVAPTTTGQQLPTGWTVLAGYNAGETAFTRVDGAMVRYDTLVDLDPDGARRSSKPFCSVEVPAGVWGVTADTPKTIDIKGDGSVSSTTRQIRVDERGRAAVWTVAVGTDELTIGALREYLFPEQAE